MSIQTSPARLGQWLCWFRTVVVVFLSPHSHRPHQLQPVGPCGTARSITSLQSQSSTASAAPALAPAGHRWPVQTCSTVAAPLRLAEEEASPARPPPPAQPPTANLTTATTDATAVCLATISLCGTHRCSLRVILFLFASLDRIIVPDQKILDDELCMTRH